MCPTEAAKKRGEVEKTRAFHAERKTSCSICAGAGVTTTDHREYHLELAAKDSAGVSSGGGAMLAGPAGGGKGKGKDNKKKDKGKGKGGSGGSGDGKDRKPGVCYEAVNKGKCEKDGCPYDHSAKAVAEAKKAKAAKDKDKGKGKGNKGGKGKDNPSCGGLASGGPPTGEFRTMGDLASISAYCAQRRDASYTVGGSTSTAMALKGLEELGETEFTKTPTRPCGYTAQSRVHFGENLCMACLFDTGASCIGIREEEVLELISFCQQGLKAGSLSISDPAYPIKRLETLARREPLTALATNAPVYVTHGIVLRTEFRPEARQRTYCRLGCEDLPEGELDLPWPYHRHAGVGRRTVWARFSSLQGHLCIGYVGQSGAAAGFGPP